MKYPKMDWGTMEAIINKLGGEEGVSRFLRDELTIRESDLLKRITTVMVPAAQRFVAKDHLKDANVGWMGGNFKKFFLDKVEEGVPEAKLAVSRLERASWDAPILAELGDKAESPLSYLFDLLTKQSKGEDGVLLTNGYVNILYVRDTDGNLWAVYANWNSDTPDWNVEADSLGHLGGWLGGFQILSCDS